MDSSAQKGGNPGAGAGHRMHWHVVLTHFPISAFLGSFTFMALHLATENACYALAAYVSLIAGAAVMIPTTMTGWIAWKKNYRGARGTLFVRKIWISYAMIIISIALVLYQSLFPIGKLDIWHFWGHFFYFSGVVLLFLGAAAEGYYGGRLSHR
ncbi:MAG TPA: hypothetical protein PLB96_06700 [Syntrophales bacterium]|nr:hypothetical protein [Syntrophales bacterium]